MHIPTRALPSRDALSDFLTAMIASLYPTYDWASVMAAQILVNLSEMG